MRTALGRGRRQLRSGALLLAAVVVATGVSGVAAAAPVTTPPGEGSVDLYDVGDPVIWEPGAVNRTPTGKAPTGTWTPPGAAGAGGAGGAGAAPIAPEDSSVVGVEPQGAVATDPFPGSGGAGAALGVQPFYATETVELTDRLSATVNLATGNLVLRSSDVQLNAPGLTLRVDSFRNSRASGAGSLGPGAVLSTGHDVGLQVTSSTVTFYGPSGFTAAFTSNGSGGWTAPAGVNADLVRNADQTWRLTYRKSGERLSFTTGGYLVGDVDRNGVGLALAYDTSNRVSSVTDGAGRVTTFAYTAAGTVDTITDPYARITNYVYDTAGALKEIRYPSGDALVFDPSSAGRVAAITTPRTGNVAFTYDTSNRLTQMKRYVTAGATTGDAATTGFAYPSSTTTTETSPTGGTTTYTLDSLGRTTKVVDPLGNTRSRTWTANSDVATATDALGTGGVGGNVTTYTYDTANNVTAVAAPTGAATRAAYAQGTGCTTTDTIHPYQAKCVTDAQGNISTLTYDTPGNLTVEKRTTPTGTVQRSYAYQSATTGGTQCGGKAGQICSSTDGRGNTTTYAYNSAGDLITIDQPAPLGQTTLTYDAASRVDTATNGKGETTHYDYDAMDRLTKTTFVTTAQATNFYDGDGNLTRTLDSSKGTDLYTYDALNRETSRQLCGMATAFLTSYDLSSNVTSVSDPQGTVNYVYNTANQLTTMREPTTINTTFTYDANGAELTRTFPNGVTQTTTRDASGRATRIRAVNSASAVLSDLSYSYTAAGTGTVAQRDRFLVQTRTATVAVAGIPNGTVTTYGYDVLNRLTAATERTSGGTANASWAYGYDANGNRTTQTLTGSTGATAGTTSYTYNAADQLTSRNGSTTGWSYDANGAQTSSPDWGTAVYGTRDDLFTVTKAGATTTHQYLGVGNTTRTSTTTSTTSSTFTNGSLGITGETRDGQDRAYRRLPDGSPVSRYIGGVRNYYLTDNLGSVIAMTGQSSPATLSAEYAYDPYGNARATTGGNAATNPLRFTGGYLDSSTGLYKFGARYYDPLTTRFTQQDPSGQEDNAYLYAAGDPCNNTDPTGLSCTRAISDLVFGTLGLGASAVGIILLAPSIAGGVAAVIGFQVSTYAVVVAIGDVEREC